MSKNTFFKEKVSFWFGAISAETTILIVFPGLHCFGPKKNFCQTDSVHEKARFFSLPDTNSVRQSLLKIHFFAFSHFWITTFKKKTNFIGFLGLFHIFFCFVFSFFCFYFSNIKKEKTKNAIFFSKTSFLTSPKICKTLFWHTVALFVFLKMPPKHYKNGENSETNLGHFLTLNLDHFLILKPPNLGPLFNFTAYIYMHIYIYIYQRKFLRVRRGCQASQKKGLTSGEVWETSGEVRGTFGEVWETSGGTSGLLLSSTVRELPGKSPKNFRGSLGNFRGSPGTFQKLGGPWLPPSNSPTLCSNIPLRGATLSISLGPCSPAPMR